MEKMMTRLTNEIRNSIRDAALKAAFEPRQEAHALAEAALAKEAYETVFPEDVRKLVAKVPANWFRDDSCLNFNIGGLRIRLKTGGKGYPVPFRTTGSSGYSCHDELGVIASGDLCDRIQAHAKSGEAMREEYKAASRGLEATLASISSVARLKEAWPEGEAFYARFADTKAPSLPAIRFADINAKLGLSAS